MKRPISVVVWTVIFVLTLAWGIFQIFRGAPSEPAVSQLAVAIMIAPLLLFAVVLVAYWRLSRWAVLLILAAMIYQTVRVVSPGGHYRVAYLTSVISIAWPLVFTVSAVLIWRRLHWGVFNPPKSHLPPITEVFD